MSYSAYLEYKESRHHWLPVIPLHWDSTPLRLISKRYSGGTPDKKNSLYWQGGTVPWLNSGAVNQGMITKPSTFITEEALANSSAKWIDEDSIVIALAGQGKTKGTAAYTTFKTTCNQSMAVVVFESDYPKFMYWWLVSQYRNIRGLASDDGRDGLNLEMIGSIPCPRPEKDEQEQIVKFLDHKTAQIDRLIEKKKVLIEKLNEKRITVMTKAVTKGLDPDVPMRDSEVEWLGEVPAHWESWKVTHGFSHVGSGTTPKSDNSLYYGGNTPWVTTSELRESVIKDTKIKVTEKALNDYATLKVYKEGALAIAMYGATIGRLGIFGIDAAVNQACCVFSEPEKFDIKFFYYWLWMRRPMLIALSVGGGQPNLSQDDLKQLRVPIPSIKEQCKIADFIDVQCEKIDKFIDKVNIAIEYLAEYRIALITAAVTGKIDVRNIKIPEEA